MSYTERLSEAVYPLDIAFADAAIPSVINGAWVNVSLYHRLWLVINVGDLQAGGTFDATVQQATTTAGAGAKAITSSKTLVAKAITQLTQAGGDSDSIVCIELQTEEMDVTNLFDCVRFVITVGVANAEYSAILYGCISRHRAVPTTNWTEIID